MFTKKIDEIFTQEKLSEYLSNKKEIQKLHFDLLSGKYIPKVMKRVYIPKNENKNLL